MITVNVDNYQSGHIKRLSSVLSEVSEASGVINAKVVEETEARELNRRYAGKDKSTDVLSFSYLENTESGVRDPKSELRTPDLDLGDIVISRQHLERQAAAAGTDEETEFILLLLHGILHILGYDHQDESGRDRLDRLQMQIMDRLGLKYRNFNWQE